MYHSSINLSHYIIASYLVWLPIKIIITISESTAGFWSVETL